MKKWYKEHASVIYIGVLLLLGIAGFVVGFFLSQSTDTKIKPWGDFCVQLFGSIIAVALTAVFFSISDMRNSLAQVVADLLGRGEVARHVTDKDKRHLAKRIVEARASDMDFVADVSLFDHLDELTLGTVNTIYLENVQHKKTLQRIPGDPDKLMAEISMSYVICRPPGLPSPLEQTIEHIFKWDAHESIAPKSDDWVKRATIQIGKQKYGRELLVIDTGESKDGLVTCTCVLKQQVSIPESLSVSIKLTFISSVLDPVDIKIAPYPCNGFSLDLQFEPGLFYDCQFFGATVREKAAIERGIVERRSNGISFRYDGWVLPGEGVISYYQTGCKSSDVNPADVKGAVVGKPEKLAEEPPKKV